jgi:hypothetical protein
MESRKGERMKTINVSLKKAIRFIESDLDNIISEYGENEDCLNDLPKKYKEDYLLGITSLKLALICMNHVLKNKCIKELNEKVV